NYPEQSTASPDSRPQEKTNAVPREFQFQGGGYRRCQAGRPPWCAPSGIDRRCGLRRRTGFFSRPLDKLMDRRRATNATAHVLATERKAANCILVMEVAGSRYLPSHAHTKGRI